MDKQEEKRIIQIYGPDYKEKDIPSYIRKRDKEEKAKYSENNPLGGSIEQYDIEKERELTSR